MSLTFGSLFAGIGGFDLGFERAGLRCEWQVEIDPFARKVLAKHWPDVRRWDDVRTFPPEPADEWKVDVICGGFPCQDISVSGKGAGLDGERSGLWSQIVRVAGVLRPRVIVVENVPALLVRGFERVLGDLAELGCDAEWDCIPAGAVGAAHLRDRVFVVAYDRGLGAELEEPGNRRPAWAFPAAPQPAVVRLAERAVRPERVSAGRLLSEWSALSGCDEPERFVGGVVPRVPSRVDRLRGLGNAVVPQVAEWIGRRLMEAASSS